MALAGPRREEEEDARSLVARDGVALVWLEVDERADGAGELVRSRREARRPGHDDNPGVLLHLVLAELLTGLDLEQHGPCLGFAQQDDRVARPVRGLDRAEIPGLHRGDSSEPPLHSLAVGLDVVQLVSGPFAENTYVLRPASGGGAIVVDPGWDAARIERQITEMGTRCAAILITHGDVDHVAAVADLAEATGAPVHMAAADRDRLERPNDFLPAGLPYRVRPYSPDVLLDGEETLELAGATIDVVPIPGHTANHLAYATDGALFSGDLLFAGSVGRTDRPGDDWERLLASIRLLAERFPPETLVYPGHGEPTTLGHELDTNPFLGELRVARQ